MVTLGVWDGHDAGAALFEDGALTFAVNEERLTRLKLDVSFPNRSIALCLSARGLATKDVSLVACSTSDPAKTLTRWFPALKERYYRIRRRQTAPGRVARLSRAAKYRMTEWAPGPVSNALSRAALRRELAASGLAHADLVLIDHHEAHAAGAAFASGFDRCAVLTIDGVGDGASCTINHFDGHRLTRVRTTPADRSLGVFFEHVTTLLNMRELEDEGKVMALADFASTIADADNPFRDLVSVEDGRIAMRSPSRSLAPHLRRVQWFFPNEQFALVAQRTVERIMEALARETVRLTGERKVALAGGVASNIKATRRMRLSPDVEQLYVFPHMGDGGLAAGAAAAALARRNSPVTLQLDSLALGPSYDEASIESALDGAALRASRAADLPSTVADLLCEDRIVLWFQGRMEYGPRALGCRSVLARPDRMSLRSRLNLVLKRRVWYQPFCPGLLAAEAPVLFEDFDPFDSRSLAQGKSLLNPHMTMAYVVREEWRERLQGVINVDGSCRPQLVRDEDDSLFKELLLAMQQRRGTSVVLNTSFNIHGKPLVCTPSEAVSVFLECGADALAIGPYLVSRQ